ncbi:MAG: 50S ribosomal protein L23 [Candidatus Niyogibacteria bacterium]|nr:50S ribosomal protein L23 [Candidatus Niyogibacteria bacterium]
MGLFNIFKRKKEKERFEKKRKEKLAEPKLNPVKNAVAGEAERGKAAAKLKESKLAQTVIFSPHLTEKSAYLSEELIRKEGSGGHYVFEVKDEANKPLIKKAIEELYGVKVKSVRILPKHCKIKFSRGVSGRRTSHKKTLVILKEGDKIEFV